MVARWARAARMPGAPAPDAPAPADTQLIPTGQAYGGRVPLARQRWLLPAATSVLVVGLLTGGVMAALALPSGDTGTPSNAARPLPGSVADPSQPPARTPTADPTPTAGPTPTAAPIPTPPPTAAPATPPGQFVPPVATLRTVSSQCLTVDGNNDGARTHAATCDGSVPQHWLLSPLNTNTYLIVNAAGGKCLDVSDVSKDDGAQIHLWSCNMAPNQQWKVARQGDAFALVSVNSGKCAAIEGDGGTKQRDCHDDAGQRWTIQAG